MAVPVNIKAKKNSQTFKINSLKIYYYWTEQVRKMSSEKELLTNIERKRNALKSATFIQYKDAMD